MTLFLTGHNNENDLIAVISLIYSFLHANNLQLGDYKCVFLHMQTYEYWRLYIICISNVKSAIYHTSVYEHSVNHRTVICGQTKVVVLNKSLLCNQIRIIFVEILCLEVSFRSLQVQGRYVVLDGLVMARLLTCWMFTFSTLGLGLRPVQAVTFQELVFLEMFTENVLSHRMETLTLKMTAYLSSEFTLCFI